MGLGFCEVKIPKKSNKLANLGEFTIFIREAEKKSYVYETTTKVQLQVFDASTWSRERIIEYIEKRKEKVINYIKENNGTVGTSSLF